MHEEDAMRRGDSLPKRERRLPHAACDMSHERDERRCVVFAAFSRASPFLLHAAVSLLRARHCLASPPMLATTPAASAASFFFSYGDDAHPSLRRNAAAR